MFAKTLSEEYHGYYWRCQYRERIDMLEASLANLRYSRDVIDQHVHEWLRFSRYCDKTGIDVPSSIYAQEIGDYVLWRLPTGSESRQRFIRASLRILIEADDQGTFTRRIHARARPTTALFKMWVPPYLSFLQEHRGVSEKTLRKNCSILREFTEFLEHSGIRDLRNLKALHVHNFCMNSNSRKPVTWVSYIGFVRRFIQYVFVRQGTEQDLSFAVGGAKNYRYAGLQDVFTETEVNKLLVSIDRSDAIGRRDYAVLLLAARYGMRPSDIRRISLDDIHWRDGCIVFCQSKTGKQLSLPLLPEVSQALIEYLRDGRPLTKVRNVFIRHKAPFEPFVSDNNLWTIMDKALRSAGLDQRLGPRGLYLLRHNLATNMLVANVSIKTIGDILGHASTDSTFVYTKIDLPALRTASLSMAEVLL
jgi:site-specific recombinase XerD